jgi:hypothetical protein
LTYFDEKASGPSRHLSVEIVGGERWAEDKRQRLLANSCGNKKRERERVWIRIGFTPNKSTCSSYDKYFPILANRKDNLFLSRQASETKNQLRNNLIEICRKAIKSSIDLHLNCATKPKIARDYLA